MILFIDTETNGLPLWKEYNNHPAQPHICQIAMLGTDKEGFEMFSFKSLVYPEGWSIGEDTNEIHGITTLQCEDYGLPIRNIFELVIELVDKGVGDIILVAHNTDFDLRMLDIEAIRCKNNFDIFSKSYFCTMKASTPICKLPGNYGYKWPKLQEAHKHFFGEEFDGAHDALADVRACKRVYFELMKRNSQTTEIKP